jgi:hypothetical protein
LSQFRYLLRLNYLITYFSSLFFMSRRWYRRGRPRTGHLSITYDPDPFRIRPDRSLTSGIATHADLVAQADRLREQGIIPSPAIVQSELFLGSFVTTLAAGGWFPDSVHIDLADHYPPGITMFAFTLQWEGTTSAQTNLRIVNADGDTATVTALGLGVNFHRYLIWVFPGGAMPSLELGSFVFLQRARPNLTVLGQYDVAILPLVQPLTLEVTPYINQSDLEITTSVYGNLAKPASG